MQKPPNIAATNKNKNPIIYWNKKSQHNSHIKDHTCILDTFPYSIALPYIHAVPPLFSFLPHILTKCQKPTKKMFPLQETLNMHEYLATHQQRGPSKSSNCRYERNKLEENRKLLGKSVIRNSASCKHT